MNEPAQVRNSSCIFCRVGGIPAGLTIWWPLPKINGFQIFQNVFCLYSVPCCFCDFICLLMFRESGISYKIRALWALSTHVCLDYFSNVFFKMLSTKIFQKGDPECIPWDMKTTKNNFVFLLNAFSSFKLILVTSWCPFSAVLAPFSCPFVICW